MKGWSCSRRASPRLEPYAPKGSRTVPRGKDGRKAILLPDYMIEHFGLESLVTYQLEPVSATTRVVNPAARTLASQIKSKAAQLRACAKINSDLFSAI